MSSDSDGGSVPAGPQPPFPPQQPDEVAGSPQPLGDPPPEPSAPRPTGSAPGAYEPPPSPYAAPPQAPPPAAPPAAPPVAPVEPVEPEADAAPEEKKQGSFLKELPILILIAFGLALLIKSFLIQAFYIPSESMVPTLNIGDRVLVNKVVYKIREPRRGEVIVFVGQRFETDRSFWQRVRDSLTSGFGGKQGPERDFIKRVIGLPGETVEGAGGRVTITRADGGAPFTLDEPYLASDRTEPFDPIVVPDGSYFVMGDNRSNSSDSRGALGPIPKKEIVGRAFVRVWPIGRFHRLTRPDYADAAAVALPVLLWTARRRRDAVA